MTSSNKIPYRIHHIDATNLDNKTSQEIKINLAILEREFNKKTEELKNELKRRQVLIELEKEKLDLINQFRKYFRKCDVLLYKERVGIFSTRLSFYMLEFDLNLGQLIFRDLNSFATKSLCNLLDIKYVFDTDHFYIQLTKKITLDYISEMFFDITKIELKLRKIWQ